MHHDSTDQAPHTRAGAQHVGGRRMLGAGLAVLLGVAGLSACTSDAQPKPTPTTTSTAQAGITEITDAPGSGAGLVGALADKQVETCELADGAWNVAGTVTNSSEASASYRIYVSLLTEGGDTRSLTQVNVDPIDAGTETEWSTTVAVNEKDLSCVLRVERYAAEAPVEGEPEG